MDRLRLKWRIFAFLLGFCALLVVILWVFQSVLLTDMYKMVRRAEMERAITLVEQNIDSADLQSVFNELQAEQEILVMPTQEFAVPDGFGRGDPPRRPMETVTETKEFTLADGETVSLTFYAIITPVEATVSTLRFQLYIIIGMMIICSIVIAILIARHISKPIEEISEGAKTLASGNYDTRFTGHGFLEIKELSDTLNTAAAELSQVEGLRRELMANVSHDLRTPLALIYSYAEMMHDFPAEITPDQTQMIMDETSRLTSLVNDVLEVSRLETGAMELHISTYNLTDSVGDTIARVAELVKQDGYNIHFEYDNEVYVAADEIKITQTFYNLLINAIHYSAADKNINVRQSVDGDKVKIAVVDHGEGISPENLPYIWERYYKVDKKHKRALTGTGLGLSIVKKIIERHGGSCGVDSQPDVGSTFWFKLTIA